MIGSNALPPSVRIASVVALLSLAACATNVETILRNEDGQIRYCYLTHDSTLANVEYNRCLNEAGAAGYKKTQ